MTERTRLSVGATSVLATRTFSVAMAAATTFVLARLLAPADWGAYYLLILVPQTMLALLSFGLPSSLTYFTGRGENLDEMRTLAVGLALGLSSALALLLIVLQPLLASTVLAAAPADLLPLVIMTIPGVFTARFCRSVILGRQGLRSYNLLDAARSVVLLGGQILVVGVAGAGLTGAVATYFLVSVGIGIAAVIAMIRLEPFRPRIGRSLTRRLTGYGVVVQPASLAGFFNYRADIYLLSILLRDPSALGVYGVAVSIAELCFYIPDAVSTVLFPRVAGSSPEQARAMIPAATRTVLLLTVTAAAALAVVTIVGIPLLLPAYAASIAPTLILLPGIVALAASKILSAYLTGSGRPGPVSAISTSALVLNLILNLALIPSFGPAGAAAASLASYTFHGSAMMGIGARQAAVRVRELVVPKRDDLRLISRLVMTPLRARRNR